MKKVLILCMAISLLNSCTSVVPFSQPVPLGTIATKDVTIKAEDGSFEFKTGERWTPPYQNVINSQFHVKDTDVLNLYNWALEAGAKKVRVKVPSLKEELYGILLLNKVNTGCDFAVTRSYQISIPDSYVQQALNGKISVVYEHYPRCGPIVFEGPFEAKTWTLWLSDIPFR